MSYFYTSLVFTARSLSTTSRVVGVCCTFMSFFLAFVLAACIFNRLSQNPIKTGAVHLILHHAVDLVFLSNFCVQIKKKSLTREIRSDTILLYVSYILFLFFQKMNEVSIPWWNTIYLNSICASTIKVLLSSQSHSIQHGIGIEEKKMAKHSGNNYSV